MTKIDAPDEIDFMIFILDVSDYLYLELDETLRVDIMMLCAEVVAIRLPS